MLRGEDLGDRVHLVGLALIDVVDLEVAGADGHNLRVALGDKADLEAGEAGDADAHSVVRGEALDLGCVAIGAATQRGNDGDIAVGEDAVDVVEQDFDATSAVFRSDSRHTAMILATTRGATTARGARRFACHCTRATARGAGD